MYWYLYENLCVTPNLTITPFDLGRILGMRYNGSIYRWRYTPQTFPVKEITKSDEGYSRICLGDDYQRS